VDDHATMLGKVAYRAYGSATGGRNYQGHRMPNWENLGQAIQRAWVAAAAAAVERAVTVPDDPV
jgi:hypothetical protein